MIYILNKICKKYFSKISTEELLSTFINDNTIVICIGSSKISGDSIGPLVGSILTKSNFCLPVYGTSEDPIHSINLEKKISSIRKKHKHCRILAIDASITKNKNNVGDILCNIGGVSPGAGVERKFKRKFRKIGHVRILGITESYDENMTPEERIYKLMDTDEKFVEDIANTIATLIQRGYEKNQNCKIKLINKIILTISMIGR